MASLTLSALPPTITITITTSPLSSKTSSHRFKVSCNASSSDENQNQNQNQKLILPVDRRNLLVGLGGLYGAANLTGSALAYPVTPDSISKCVNAMINGKVPTDAIRGVACCPPTLGQNENSPKPYELPKDPKLRLRPAAHRVTGDYVDLYQLAVKRMKALPDHDPCSWKQQAKIHCAYCNGAYMRKPQSGEPKQTLQVHNSWLFFPFHRWYLYFFERILGSLIKDMMPKDTTFALPYWNWDNPTGMMLPAMFEAPARSDENPEKKPNPKFNPLFDPFRNVNHLPPSIVDLDYKGAESGLNCVDQISTNLATMYGQMISTPINSDLFFGTNPDSEGGAKAGSVESGCHTAMHIWAGNPRMTYNEDMGNFYSAGYDPLFYSHHANVDRMWNLWKDPKKLLKDSKESLNQDPTSEDWLNSSYLLYDENRQLVRVYNKDCVDTKKMGYDYEDSRLPWRLSRPVPKSKASNVAAKSVGAVNKAEDANFPAKLDDVVKFLVKRPDARERSEKEKKEKSEMLFVNGIRYKGDQFIKFDVLVNDVDDGTETTAASSEFAGTFMQLEHNEGNKDMLMTTGTAFGITQLLEDLEAEKTEYVLVTLVPRAGTEGATISGIKIDLIATT